MGVTRADAPIDVAIKVSSDSGDSRYADAPCQRGNGQVRSRDLSLSSQLRHFAPSSRERLTESENVSDSVQSGAPETDVMK